MGPDVLTVADRWSGRVGVVPDATEAAAKPAHTMVKATKRRASFIISNPLRIGVVRSRIAVLFEIIIEFMK